MAIDELAEAIGKRFPDLAALPAEPASRVMSPIEGRRDFIAVARVRDTPLVLTVTRDETVAMQPWRDEAARLAARTIVVTLLGLAAIAALFECFMRSNGRDLPVIASDFIFRNRPLRRGPTQALR